MSGGRRAVGLLLRYLRRRRAFRHPRTSPVPQGRDLLLGSRNTAIVTLVERTSRFVVLLRLPQGRSSEQVLAAIARRFRTLPDRLCRSLAWDQGKEMARHARFTVETGLRVFICDPRSPWQRGTNENTNGLIRQYFPKYTDLGGITQQRLDAVAAELNDRPRKTLTCPRYSYHVQS